MRYDASGVPYLSVRRIEEVAFEVLSAYGPQTLDVVGPTPVAEVLEGVELATGLRVRWADLVFLGGTKTLGRVSFPEKTLTLDVTLAEERKAWFRYTAAHELGHWMLHRHRWRELHLEGPAGFMGEFSDNEKSLSRLDPQTSREWLEFQANVFAASMVMPWGPFQKAVVAAQMQSGFRDDPEAMGRARLLPGTIDLDELVRVLAASFDVSRAAVEVRLRAMQLMLDETGESESVISQIATKSSQLDLRQPNRRRR